MEQHIVKTIGLYYFKGTQWRFFFFFLILVLDFLKGPIKLFHPYKNNAESERKNKNEI